MQTQKNSPGSVSNLPMPLALPADLRTNRFNLSVEEENLASFPFAVLEQRVGKKIAKLEVKGNKLLPDGTEVQVVWEVQGSPELGLPTEQDLDVFVAIGVLTFRNHFSKTVVFQGREIARILNIASVHGRFYDRLKIAMDRLIALRFRALTQTERSEDVKWTNIFQEASFTANRDTGRCEGSVTWTDKIIQAMDSGFFRLFDAQRYMELDGLTAKHMYRYLAVAFESNDVVITDMRALATQYLAIPKPPAYFSRLLQTIEPVLEQLRRREIVGSWHVISKADWRLAIRRHANYVPERKLLLTQPPLRGLRERREHCREVLEHAGIEADAAARICDRTNPGIENYDGLERAARLLIQMCREEVVPHVAAQMIAEVLEAGPDYSAWREALDWMETGVVICEQKRRAGRPMRNGAGFIVKLARDSEARQRLVGASALTWQQTFRNRETVLARQHQEDEERFLLADYEEHREGEARRIFNALSEDARQQLRHQKQQQTGSPDWLSKMSQEQQRQEMERAVLADIARQHVPPFEKWRLRRMAQQAMLPFAAAAPEEETAAV